MNYLMIDTLSIWNMTHWRHFVQTVPVSVWGKMSAANMEFKRSSLSLMLQCKSNTPWWKTHTYTHRGKNRVSKSDEGPEYKKKDFLPKQKSDSNGFCGKPFVGPWESEYLLMWESSPTDHLFHQVSQKALRGFFSKHSLQAIINSTENNVFFWGNIIFHISLQWTDEREKEREKETTIMFLCGIGQTVPGTEYLWHKQNDYN